MSQEKRQLPLPRTDTSLQPLAAGCAFCNSASLGEDRQEPCVHTTAPSAGQRLLFIILSSPPGRRDQEPHPLSGLRTRKREKENRNGFLCSSPLFSDLLLTLSRSCRNSGGNMECCGESMSNRVRRAVQYPASLSGSPKGGEALQLWELQFLLKQNK